MNKTIYLAFIFMFLTSFAYAETPVVKPKRLKINPVSMNVVGAAEVKFEVTGGMPPYLIIASSGSLT